MGNKNQISLSIVKKPPEPEKPEKNKTLTFYKTKKEEEPPSIQSPTKDPYQFLCVMSESKKL